MKLLCTLALLVIAQFCFSQQPPKELNEIDEDINHLLKQYNAVGLSVAE